MKVFGAALSSTEIAIETYRYTNPWDYAEYMKTYWKLDNYPQYILKDYGLNASNIIYIGNEIETSRNKTAEGVVWAFDNSLKLCKSNEIYDSTTNLCYRENRALTFIRGKTTAIDIKSDMIQQNFTVEFWVNILKNETSNQKILSSPFFYINYESTLQFSFNLFNLTYTNSPVYTSISSVTTPLKTWAHVAVGNSQSVNKSCIYINGQERGRNVYVMISGAFTTYKLSDNIEGFTGYLRELKFWNEFRSSSRVDTQMHAYQWYANGLNFNLLGYYRLNEGRGYSLTDSYFSKPNTILTYDMQNPPLVPPFWISTNDLPVICGFSTFYDRDQNACRVTKKVLLISAYTTLPVHYSAGFREWSFKTFVKFNTLSTPGTTIVNISQIAIVNVTAANTIGVYVIFDNLTSSSLATYNLLDTNKWYYLSIGYSYGLNQTVSEFREALDTNTDANRTLNGACSYSGVVNISLNSGYFMHVSLWKKYASIAMIGPKSLTDMQNPYALIN